MGFRSGRKWISTRLITRIFPWIMPSWSVLFMLFPGKIWRRAYHWKISQHQVRVAWLLLRQIILDKQVRPEIKYVFLVLNTPQRRIKLELQQGLQGHTGMRGCLQNSSKQYAIGVKRISWRWTHVRRRQTLVHGTTKKARSRDGGGLLKFYKKSSINE